MTGPRHTLITRVADHLCTIEAGHPLRVAVDGITAAGKTTFADELADALRSAGRPVVRISMDGFHHPRAHRHRKGRESATGYYEDAYDFSSFARLVLTPLGPDGDRRYRNRIIDLATDTSVDEHPTLADERAVVIVDGSFLQRDLRGLWDRIVYLHSEFGAAHDRGVRRDEQLLGGRRAAAAIYRARYHAANRRYLDEVRPAASAHIVIDNTDPALPRLRSGSIETRTDRRRQLRTLPVLTGTAPAFDHTETPNDPITLFTHWLDAAIEARVHEPHAMTLSTITADGTPDARVLILKDIDAAGWHFAVSTVSSKGRDLAANPHAALTFYWRELGRQVRISGPATIDPAHVAAADFRARAEAARVLALTRRQSTPVADPTDIDDAVTAAAAELAADPARVPAEWRSYAVAPERVEFWQADPLRRHRRLEYRRTPTGWTKTTLWP